MIKTIVKTTDSFYFSRFTQIFPPFMPQKKPFTGILFRS